MRPAASPFNTPHNLWAALTFSRSTRMGMQQNEQDAKEGRIRLINEDAIKE